MSAMSFDTRKWFVTSFEEHQKNFVLSSLAKLPQHWANDVRSKHSKLIDDNGGNLKKANNYLTKLVEPIESSRLDISADDDEVKELSQKIAWRIREAGSFELLKDKSQFWQYCRDMVHFYDARFPDKDEFSLEQTHARLIDDYWWLRQLRVSHAKAREVCAINAGLVHKHKNLYVSDDTLERRKQQCRRNKNTLANIELQNSEGEIMSLSDIVESSISNPDNRRAELMTRISGFEELSIKYGHHAEFVTITTPSRMHAVLRSGNKNPKYDGTKPDEAQRYLVKVWAQVRAKFHRDGFQVYGFRVAEPHHDGTPHWHLILFFNPEYPKAKRYLRDVISKYFLREDGDERGAKKNRVTYISINPLKGTASGYIAKYIAKNIGGIEGEMSDENEKESSESAGERVEAWASTWRIRQFQQIGGHFVTVWRELRRVDEKEAEPVPQIFEAWKAAQKTESKKASFAEYIESMGGLHMPPRDSVLCVDDDYISRRGRYGETLARVLRGVRQRWGLGKAKTNRDTWERVSK